MKITRSWSQAHFAHQISRRIKGSAGIAEICDERIVVQEAERDTVPATIFLPEQLDNVRQYHPETLVEAEEVRVRGGPTIHMPTVAFRITGAKLRDCGLYKNNWSYYFPKVPFERPAVKTTGRSYAVPSSYSGIQYFGHWMHDDVMTYMAAQDFAEPLCLRTPDWPHLPAYLNAFDISWPVYDYGDIDELFFFIDFSQNSYKARRYRELRSRLAAKHSAIGDCKRVYLRRGETGANKRIISNGDEMEAALETEGFLILDLETDPIEKIISSIRAAEIYLSIEGSQNNHALMSLAEGGGVLAIVPPQMFNNSARDWTSVLNMHYAIVVGEDEGDAFRVDIAALMQTVELLDRAVSKTIG